MFLHHLTCESGAADAVADAADQRPVVHVSRDHALASVMLESHLRKARQQPQPSRPYLAFRPSIRARTRCGPVLLPSSVAHEAGPSFRRREGMPRILSIPSSLGKGRKRALNENSNAGNVGITLARTRPPATSLPHLVHWQEQI